MIHEKSVDTKVIEALLAEAVVGQVITYEEMSKAIGRDVRQHALSSLVTARRSLEKDKRIVFGVERNVGLKRLNDVEIVSTAESSRRHMQRTAKRSLTKLATVNFENLDADAKRQHVTYSAQLGALAMFAAKASTKKIEGKVNGSSRDLPIGETLKLFS